MPERNLLTTSRFLLEIDGIIQASFTEAKLPEISVAVIEHRNGDDPPTMRKTGNIVTYGPLTLSSGITFDEAASLELENWFQDIIDGKIETSRKNISVILLTPEGNEGVRYNIINAFPSKLTVSPLNSKNNETAIKTVEFQNEGCKRVK
jgi:phage tail-like protein